MSLVHQLDADLNARYGKAQSEYDQHNVIEENQTVLVCYVDDVPMGCGCFKEMVEDTVELKRIFIASEQRGNGYSKLIVAELEKWASELCYKQARLETGKGQPEAIGLYSKCGYTVTENYGPYVGMDDSVCMLKLLA